MRPIRNAHYVKSPKEPIRACEIRGGGKVGGVDRIAVMAALNIANDLLRERRDPYSAKEQSKRRKRRSGH